MLVRSQTSPDGTLTLEIYEADDLIGFRDEGWHTHGDLLVPDFGRTAEEARNAFFDQVVADRIVICIWPEREPPMRVDVTLDPEATLRATEAEAVVMRLWSGTVVHGRPAP